MAAYARMASAGEAQVLHRVLYEAARLAAPVGWAVSPSHLATPIHAGVLWRGRGRLALPRRYRPFWPYFRSQADRTYRATAYLRNSPAPSAVQRGLVLFDFGLFFACHEHFEGLWRDAAPPDRDFYQGLVQLAAAFYHHEKGNRHGAAVLLGRATRRLAAYRPAHLGVDVEAVLAELARWEARFATGSPAPYPVLAAGRARDECVR